MPKSEQESYVILTGKWPKGKTVGDFINASGLEDDFKGGFQINQTFSEYKLEKIILTENPDEGYLEQYRAFSEKGELWIRRTEEEGLRFRFIYSGVDDKDVKDKLGGFCECEVPTTNDSIHRRYSEYPLWGEPLAGDAKKRIPQGWYTKQIPRIQNYPVPFPDPAENKRVYLKTEEWLRQDGTVEMVRFTGMEVKPV